MCHFDVRAQSVSSGKMKKKEVRIKSSKDGPVLRDAQRWNKGISFRESLT